MLTDLFRQLYRQIRSNRLMTLINLLGLFVGMTVFLLIALYVRQEFSYDRHHPDADQVYIVDTYARFGSDVEIFAPIVSAPIAVDMANEISDIELFTRLDQQGSNRQVAWQQTSFLESDIAIVDSSFFKVFASYEFLLGDPETALQAPNSVVLTEETAHKFFGTRDPLGEEMVYSEMVYSNRVSLTVTGVVRPSPKPTHLDDFPMFISWPTFEYDEENGWLSDISYMAYFKLREGADPVAVEAQMARSCVEHAGPILEAFGGTLEFSLRPIDEIHLYAKYTLDGIPTGVLQSVLQLAAVGLLVLVIACMNYMNLTTAMATRRARSVSLRKTLGATRTGLVRQFVLESVIEAGLVTLLAVVAATLLGPHLTDLFGVELVVNPLLEPLWIPLALLFGLIVGALAGLYPAVVLSAFSPLSVLRGELTQGRGGNRLRSSLVILQFALSVILIISTVVVMQQMNYTREKDIGFDKEHVLAVRLSNDELRDQAALIREEMLRNPAVLSASLAERTPVGAGSNSIFHIPGAPVEDQMMIAIKRGDENYIPTLRMRLLSGRNFDPGIVTDSASAIIVNQAAARMLGYEDPVGRTIDDIATVDPITFNSLNIIGMVEDFHYESFHTEIRPLFLQLVRGGYSDLLLRIQPGSAERVVEALEQTWQANAPGTPLHYDFLDALFNGFYRDEIRQRRLVRNLTIIAVFIAAIGLFALATFAAERRTKEIGVRKVLGASEGSVVVMLVRQFVVLVAIANLIAWPAAWLLMEAWLDSFVYRVELGWTVFALAGVLSLVVALLTVSSQALRAARTNPVKALRAE